jgi:hypothetical protein
MTILFAGSEQEAFSLVGASGISLVTTAGRYQSDYSRGAMKIYDAAWAQTTFTPQTELWVHCNISNEYSIAGGTKTLEIYNSSSVGVVSAYLSNYTKYASPLDSRHLELEYMGSSGMVYVDTGFMPQQGFNIDVDIHAIIAQFGGLIELYVDGVMLASFSGDTSYLGSSFTSVRLNGDQASANAYINYSQCIVSTSTTLGMKLATLAITGAGTTSQWTGAYTDISESNLSDTSFISDNTSDNPNGDISTYPVTDVPAGGNFNVGAVIISARAERGVTGVQNLELGVRSGGVNYWGSPVSGLTTAFSPVQSILTTDPATGLPWTISNANAVEIGVRALT